MAFETIDRTAKQTLLTIQEYSLFAHRAVINLFRPPIYWVDFLLQAEIIGVGSTSIVLLAGFFTGAVLAPTVPNIIPVNLPPVQTVSVTQQGNALTVTLSMTQPVQPKLLNGLPK